MKTPVHALARPPSIVGKTVSRPVAEAGKDLRRKPDQVSWRVQGHEFVHCNGSESCGCGLNSWFGPGKHHVLTGLAIQTGFRGATNLDGLKLAAALSWPGSIREGKGELIPIIDRNATAEQARALLHVMSGEANDPGASFFQVFSSAYERVREPVFADIALDFGAEGCRLRLTTPVSTGGENRIEIALTHRFDEVFAAIGRGWSEELGTVPLNLVFPILMSASTRKRRHIGQPQNNLVRNVMDLTRVVSLERDFG